MTTPQPIVYHSATSLVRLAGLLTLTATFLLGCAQEAPRPFVKQGISPNSLVTTYTMTGFSRVPMPPGEWKLVDSVILGGTINSNNPGQVDDSGLKTEVFMSLNPANKLDKILFISTNTKKVQQFSPSTTCVYDQGQTNIYYKDIQANVTNSFDCLKIRLAPVTAPNRRSSDFYERWYNKVNQFGGVPSQAVITINSVGRRSTFVAYELLTFTEKPTSKGEAWNANALGANEALVIRQIIAQAEQLRPELWAGVGANQ